ncbi:GyrI-like domain-containing protein [Leucobacter sp. USHLN153]|uniref:GyrI-like domain-containing protein n=1 Tax=Leucobacter sp. USHLN153 TaxID=3081268 RepID=UPI0030161384
MTERPTEPATASTAPAEPEIVERPEIHLAVVREIVPMDRIPELYDRGYSAIFAELQRLGISPAAPPMGVVHGAPGPAGIDLSAAVPIPRPLAVTDGVSDASVTSETLPAARTATLLVRGDYAGIAAGYERLYAWIVERGETPGELAWEQYLTEPVPGGDPAGNETLLGVPLAPR